MTQKWNLKCIIKDLNSKEEHKIMVSADPASTIFQLKKRKSKDFRFQTCTRQACCERTKMERPQSL